jgi:hypothetical protein
MDMLVLRSGLQVLCMSKVVPNNNPASLSAFSFLFFFLDLNTEMRENAGL